MRPIVQLIVSLFTVPSETVRPLACFTYVEAFSVTMVEEIREALERINGVIALSQPDSDGNYEVCVITPDTRSLKVNAQLIVDVASTIYNTLEEQRASALVEDERDSELLAASTR